MEAQLDSPGPRTRKKHIDVRQTLGMRSAKPSKAAGKLDSISVSSSPASKVGRSKGGPADKPKAENVDSSGSKSDKKVKKDEKIHISPTVVIEKMASSVEANLLKDEDRSKGDEKVHSNVTPKLAKSRSKQSSKANENESSPNGSTKEVVPPKSGTTRSKRLAATMATAKLSIDEKQEDEILDAETDKSKKKVDDNTKRKSTGAKRGRPPGSKNIKDPSSAKKRAKTEDNISLASTISALVDDVLEQPLEPAPASEPRRLSFKKKSDEKPDISTLGFCPTVKAVYEQLSSDAVNLEVQQSEQFYFTLGLVRHDVADLEMKELDRQNQMFHDMGGQNAVRAQVRRQMRQLNRAQRLREAARINSDTLVLYKNKYVTRQAADQMRENARQQKEGTEGSKASSKASEDAELPPAGELDSVAETLKPGENDVADAAMAVQEIRRMVHKGRAPPADRDSVESDASSTSASVQRGLVEGGRPSKRARQDALLGWRFCYGKSEESRTPARVSILASDKKRHLFSPPPEASLPGAPRFLGGYYIQPTTISASKTRKSRNAGTRKKKTAAAGPGARSKAAASRKTPPVNLDESDYELDMDLNEDYEVDFTKDPEKGQKRASGSKITPAVRVAVAKGAKLDPRVRLAAAVESAVKSRKRKNARTAIDKELQLQQLSFTDQLSKFHSKRVISKSRDPEVLKRREEEAARKAEEAEKLWLEATDLNSQRVRERRLTKLRNFVRDLIKDFDCFLHDVDDEAVRVKDLSYRELLELKKRITKDGRYRIRSMKQKQVSDMDLFFDVTIVEGRPRQYPNPHLNNVLRRIAERKKRKGEDAEDDDGSSGEEVELDELEKKFGESDRAKLISPSRSSSGLSQQPFVSLKKQRRWQELTELRTMEQQRVALAEAEAARQPSLSRLIKDAQLRREREGQTLGSPTKLSLKVPASASGGKEPAAKDLLDQSVKLDTEKAGNSAAKSLTASQLLQMRIRKMGNSAPPIQQLPPPPTASKVPREKSKRFALAARASAEASSPAVAAAEAQRRMMLARQVAHGKSGDKSGAITSQSAPEIIIGDEEDSESEGDFELAAVTRKDPKPEIASDATDADVDVDNNKDASSSDSQLITVVGSDTGTVTLAPVSTEDKDTEEKEDDDPSSSLELEADVEKSTDASIDEVKASPSAPGETKSAEKLKGYRMSFKDLGVEQVPSPSGSAAPGKNRKRSTLVFDGEVVFMEGASDTKSKEEVAIFLRKMLEEGKSPVEGVQEAARAARALAAANANIPVGHRTKLVQQSPPPPPSQQKEIIIRPSGAPRVGSKATLVVAPNRNATGTPTTVRRAFVVRSRLPTSLGQEGTPRSPVTEVRAVSTSLPAPVPVPVPMQPGRIGRPPIQLRNHPWSQPRLAQTTYPPTPVPRATSFLRLPPPAQPSSFRLPPPAQPSNTIRYVAVPQAASGLGGGGIILKATGTGESRTLFGGQPTPVRAKPQQTVLFSLRASKNASPPASSGSETVNKVPSESSS